MIKIGFYDLPYSLRAWLLNEYQKIPSDISEEENIAFLEIAVIQVMIRAEVFLGTPQRFTEKTSFAALISIIYEFTEDKGNQDPANDALHRLGRKIPYLYDASAIKKLLELHAGRIGLIDQSWECIRAGDLIDQSIESSRVLKVFWEGQKKCLLPEKLKINEDYFRDCIRVAKTIEYSGDGGLYDSFSRGRRLRGSIRGQHVSELANYSQKTLENLKASVERIIRYYQSVIDWDSMTCGLFDASLRK